MHVARFHYMRQFSQPSAPAAAGSPRTTSIEKTTKRTKRRFRQLMARFLLTDLREQLITWCGHLSRDTLFTLAEGACVTRSVDQPRRTRETSSCRTSSDTRKSFGRSMIGWECQWRPERGVRVILGADCWRSGCGAGCFARASSARVADRFAHEKLPEIRVCRMAPFWDT